MRRINNKIKDERYKIIKEGHRYLGTKRENGNPGLQVGETER